jgi:subtilisin
VAIIDTGIDRDHPDLVDNIAEGVNFVRTKGKVNSNAWEDDNGHGTHCAGIVAALDNTIGVIGVAPGASLYGVKVLNSQGSGSYSDIIKGIEWSVTNGMDVISMSLSGSTDLEALEDACDAAKAVGIVVVAAAGNYGDTSLPYPAAYDSVISVGATDSSDVLASWSNTGTGLDLVAPGVVIYSTYKGDTYATLSGTSMACPHVAGTAALVLQADPTLDADGVQDLLESTADQLWSVDYPSTVYGFGLVDAAEAVTGFETPP